MGVTGQGVVGLRDDALAVFAYPSRTDQNIRLHLAHSHQRLSK
jgi:hypothetical protein